MLFHHEKFNNRGYWLPYENLPDFPKLTSICDIFDASPEPPLQGRVFAHRCLKSIVNTINVHFDYGIVSDFINNVGRLVNIRKTSIRKRLRELSTQELAIIRDFD